MSIKVNGINYGWGDVDTKIPGLNLVLQEISYDDEQEMEESYGKGSRPRGYGKGNYKGSGKMSMLRDDYDDVLDYCKATGRPFYGVEPHDRRRHCGGRRRARLTGPRLLKIIEKKRRY